MKTRFTIVLAALIMGAGALLAPTSAEAAARAQLSASRTTVFSGDVVKFSGRFREKTAKRKYLLQARTATGWRTVTKGRTARGGRFAVRLRMITLGRHTFRVVAGRSKTPTAAVAVKARPGSMGAPHRPGHWFTLGDWRVRFDVSSIGGRSDPDDDLAPAGYGYVRVPMTFVRIGAGSGTPWADLDLGFVGSNGIVYSVFTVVDGHEYYCTGADDDWINGPEMYPGGQAALSECMLVKESAFRGGMWRLSDYDSEVFITP